AGIATAAVAIGGLVGAALALPALEFTAVSLREHGLAVQDSIGILRFLRDLVRVPFDQPKPQENTFMPGLAVLALAPLALLRRRPLALALWGAVLAAAVLAIGARTPVMPLLAAHVPGFGYFRAPGRIWFLGALALPLLAGLGAEALPGPRALTRALHVLLVALVVAGVWHTDRALLNVKPAGPGHTAMHLEEKAAQLAQGSRIYGVQRNFRQSMVTALGAELADGQDPLQIAAYARFMQYAGGYHYDDYAIAIPPFEVYDREWPTHQDAQPSARVLGLLNVGVVLSRHQLYDTALVEVGKEDDTYIYRNDAVLPRAFLVSADLGRDLERMDAAELARRAIIGDVAPDARAGRAAVTVVGLDGLVVRVDAPAAAYLVVGDPWYPGWRASIDGRPAPIGKVGGVLQGIAVPAGAHEVRIEYRPASVQRGLLLSLAGLIAAALWTVWYARPWPALRRSGGGRPPARGP
ncbi:MAG: YfhO family protein, partial [Thermomicrobiaceae bacterium]|nr:YfhO family protein [Thermomicrobiaceae bacterium]